MAIKEAFADSAILLQFQAQLLMQYWLPASELHGVCHRLRD